MELWQLSIKSFEIEKKKLISTCGFLSIRKKKEDFSLYLIPMNTSIKQSFLKKPKRWVVGSKLWPLKGTSGTPLSK